MKRAFALSGIVVLFAVVAALALPANYARSLANVLVHEGGYSNDSRDPGGVTLHGVIQVRYNQYRRDRGLPHKALTPAMLRDPAWHRERDEIYKIYYANPCAFDALPLGLDYTLFDYCVNSGIGRAPKVLQRILGVEVDGKIGPETIAAVKQRDTKVLIRAINDERVRFLKALRTCQYFCTGWLRRVSSVRTISLLMSEGRSASSFGIVPLYGPGKAYDPEEIIP